MGVDRGCWIFQWRMDVQGLSPSLSENIPEFSGHSLVPFEKIQLFILFDFSHGDGPFLSEGIRCGAGLLCLQAEGAHLCFGTSKVVNNCLYKRLFDFAHVYFKYLSCCLK